MAVDPAASASVTAFRWVPPGGRGRVRDLRVRWALEEAGIDYSVRLRDMKGERGPEWLAEQPFGQIPAYRDEQVDMFETGAIVLHIGERCEALLPADPQQRARAMSWVCASLSSIEPSIQQLGAIDHFPHLAPWACAPRDAVAEVVSRKLGQLAAHLGDRDWLEAGFTAGDLMVSSVLRICDPALMAEHASLTAYVARNEARPAFQRAVAAQIADFVEDPVS